MRLLDALNASPNNTATRTHKVRGNKHRAGSDIIVVALGMDKFYINFPGQSSRLMHEAEKPIYTQGLDDWVPSKA